MSPEPDVPSSPEDREAFFADIGRPDDRPALLRVSEPSLTGNERRYVLDALDRNELSWQGGYARRFEQAFAEMCGLQDAVACCNGTAALHLALLALDIRWGDLVFLPALTYVATAAAVRYMGATPVFCDVRPDTWNLDPEQVLAAIVRAREPGVTARRRAILAVHLYGVPADMTALRQLALEYNLSLIEDAAEAHGATLNGVPAGALGDIAAFSFYANKILTTGEGGMVTTADPSLLERARLFRGQGQTRQYYHEVVGYNYRMTNIQAAIGLGQVERAAQHIAARRVVAGWYRVRLHGLGVGFQTCQAGAVASDWLTVILLPSQSMRIEVAEALAAHGVETRPVFQSITSMPPYPGPQLPVTDRIAGCGLCLPTHAGVTGRDVDRIGCILERILR